MNKFNVDLVQLNMKDGTIEHVHGVFGKVHSINCVDVVAATDFVRKDDATAALENALRKAIDRLTEDWELICGWGAYAPKWVQEKHELQKDLEELGSFIKSLTEEIEEIR